MLLSKFLKMKKTENYKVEERITEHFDNDVRTDTSTFRSKENTDDNKKLSKDRCNIFFQMKITEHVDATNFLKISFLKCASTGSFESVAWEFSHEELLLANHWCYAAMAFQCSALSWVNSLIMKLWIIIARKGICFIVSTQIIEIAAKRRSGNRANYFFSPDFFQRENCYFKSENQVRFLSLFLHLYLFSFYALHS